MQSVGTVIVQRACFVAPWLAILVFVLSVVRGVPEPASAGLLFLLPSLMGFPVSLALYLCLRPALLAVELFVPGFMEKAAVPEPFLVWWSLWWFLTMASSYWQWFKLLPWLIARWNRRRG